MLKDRLRTSAILIAVIAFLLWIDQGVLPAQWTGGAALPILVFFAAGTAWDICSMLTASERPVHRRTVTTLTAITAASVSLPTLWPNYPDNCPIGTLGWPLLVGLFGAFLLLLVEMWLHARRQDEAGQDAENTASGIDAAFRGGFVLLYVAIPIALLFALRQLVEPAWGLPAVMTLIITTKSADAGAYFAGKSLGRTKLVPRLSPGKTWEGLAGGVVVSTAAAAASLAFLFPAGTAPALAWALLLGPVLTIAGLVGDLAESLVKRQCGAKDSGDWLPGLGGVWDVTDSLLAAAAPGYLIFAAAS
ncbi:MAG: phosphatidate cytidylyltransferase [Planctomycetota bacterium]